MGRHNDVRKALNDARIPDKHKLLVRLLLDNARYADAVILDDNWAPSVSTLARRLHVVERTVQRYLADLQDNGWFDRYQTERRGRVAGGLSAGRDFGFSTEGLCPVCGKPLPSPRAKTCSDRCRKKRSDDRKREIAQVNGNVVTLPVADHGQQPADDTNCEDFTLHVGTSRQVDVRTTSSEPELTEDSNEEGVREKGTVSDLGWREFCAWCGEPPSWCDCWGCAVNNQSGCRLMDEMERAVQLVVTQLGGELIRAEEARS